VTPSRPDAGLVCSSVCQTWWSPGFLAEVPELERSTALRHNGVDVNVSRGHLGDMLRFRKAPRTIEISGDACRDATTTVGTAAAMQGAFARGEGLEPEAGRGPRRRRALSTAVGREGEWERGQRQADRLEASAAAAARPDTTIPGQ
jgi:hypothetical protein